MEQRLYKLQKDLPILQTLYHLISESGYFE